MVAPISLSSLPVLQRAYDHCGHLITSDPSIVNAVKNVASYTFNHHDSMVVVFALCVPVIIFVYVMSIISGNASQVDRLWSIFPVVCILIFSRNALYELFSRHAVSSAHLRLLVWCYFAIGWGIRLSYNFARKGGYTWSGEDPRWPVLREILHPVVYHIFNITFIAIYQIYLLAAFSSPIYVASLSSRPLNWIDFVAYGTFFTLWVIEIVADEQQWVFQNEKYRLIGEKKTLTGDYARGFLTQGLWAYSRHPNFFCEISLWWCVYLSSVAATGEWINWSLTGPVLLTLLFQGSTPFTEMISAKKYPAYKEYQQKVSRLIPFFASKMSPVSTKKVE